MSIVLPCAFEGNFAEKTVEAIWEHTKKSRIKEIIVVDDGSRPPLRTVFPERLLAGGPGRPPVRIIRHERTLGLISAKKTGGDAARGDVIVFFDCHVSPRDGWEEAFFKQMKRAGDHRTAVVPTITTLDPDTWKEVRNGAMGKTCYILWNADFTWLPNPGRDAPLMSGGLLAISRRWWQETGGYDEHMVAWGGENIDQSLRIWLCGGRIEVAEGAFVAHMWRDPKNPKTTLRYPIPTKDVMRNKARAATAWFGPWTEKVLGFPEYEQFTKRHESIGDMSNFQQLKEKLQCRPFSSYLSRFSYVYFDTGLVPTEVFQLREASTGLCAERAMREQQPHGVVLAPCSGGAGGGPAAELQLWHLGNRDRKRTGKPCCSGLMNWNFVQCLDAHSVGGRVQTFECDVAGYAASQVFELEDVGGSLKWNRGQGCIVPVQKEAEKPLQSASEVCTTWAEVTATGAFRLHGPPTGGQGSSCLTAVKQGQAQSGWQLLLQECRGDPQQLFHTEPLLDGLQVRVGATGSCLDIAGGSQLLVYACYDAEAANQNQVWQLRDQRLVWEGQVQAVLKGFCVQAAAAGPALKEVPVKVEQLTLQTCTPKRGQRLQRTDVDGQGTFLVRDADTGKCLGTGQAASGALERLLRLMVCHSSQRFRELKDSDQLQHVLTRLCLDAGNEVSPILYPCHVPKAQRKQRFRIVDDPGWVQLRSGWEDNGRKRYFERCIDHAPEPAVELSVQQCSEANERKVRWTRTGVRTPPEQQLWRDAAKTPPGAPLLGETAIGGRAAPP